MDDDNDTTGRDVALLAGGGALLWFLLRGLGFGSGGRGNGVGAASAKAPVHIRVSDDGITLDGRASDIAGASVAAKRAGAAEVVITGAARQGTATDLLAALQTTGAHLAVKGASDA